MKDFLEKYQQLNRDTLDLLESMYAPSIIFLDPVHRLEGLGQLQRYFAGLYANVSETKFHYRSTMQEGLEGFVVWQLSFHHARLQKHGPIEVEGASHLRFTEAGLVVYHRDYFDLGEMVYERLPLLGRLVKKIKQRMAQ